MADARRYSGIILACGQPYSTTAAAGQIIPRWQRCPGLRPLLPGHLAQRLLETTSLPIDQVATSAGFGTAAAMRLQFQQAFDTSPAAYRQTFRSSPAS
jgi:hypothetical protein